MTDAKKAWSDVGERISALGLKLKFHAEEELSDKDADATGIERLKKSFAEVLDAIGDAARDQAVREDAKSVASAFADAIDATVEEARAKLKQR